MARKFLYIMAILIVLAIAALFVLRVWSEELAAVALVPSEEFAQQDGLTINAYEDPDMWFSRPGIGPEQDPARWQPPPAASGIIPAADSTTQDPEEVATTPPATAPSAGPSAGLPAALPGAPPPFAVFFVHPTSYFDSSHWNASLDDAESQDRARLFVRGMGSAFNQASEIWVPRYRQATFGAFLTDAPEAQMALDAAYLDIAQAFEYFIESVDADTPIVLAGHSQGSVHILRLLRERVAGNELENRIAATYPVGWPVSIEHDLPQLPLPACGSPQQAGCIISWLSFAEPADHASMLRLFALSEGFDGQMRGEGPTLCVNPITGTMNGESLADQNLGTLVPDADLAGGELVPGAVPARCDEHGLLLIGDPPEMGPYVLPGNNYHVYDIPLFWRNLQADVVHRVDAWAAAER